MSARTGRPSLSALQAVVSSIGLTAMLVMTSPPVIVTGVLPDRLPRTVTVFRKWTDSWVWLGGDVDVVDAVERGAAPGAEKQLAPVTGRRVRAHATVTVTAWVVWVSTRV